jgi:hypothetical protein
MTRPTEFSSVSGVTECNTVDKSEVEQIGRRVRYRTAAVQPLLVVGVRSW